MTLVLLAGFAGGVIRGLVGFIKYQYSYKTFSRLGYQGCDRY